MEPFCRDMTLGVINTVVEMPQQADAKHEKCNDKEKFFIRGGRVF